MPINVYQLFDLLQAFVIILLLLAALQKMFDSVLYFAKTISQEIADQFMIIKEIIQFYKQEVKQQVETKQKITEIKAIMSKAKSYDEWRRASLLYDKLAVVEQQVNEVFSPYYDYQYLQQLVRCMREAREQGDSLKLIEVIRSHSDRNIANINSPFLYRHAYNRSKLLIEQYHAELALGFQTIIKSDLPQNKKLEFFGEVRHAVGRSALLLSGGAIMGMYHIGVVQALIEADCLPKIIAGSSAGSIIASILATHTREQLFNHALFNFTAFVNQKKQTLFEQFRRAGREGTALDIKVLEAFLRDNIGEYTFQEAYDKFGVILNITVTGMSQHDPDRLLNYLTAPNVLIWSASAASCAIPYIFGATDLYCKDHTGLINKYTLMNRKFVDGSIGQDLPMNKLSILFNVNNFIVSQTNPWVVPFMDYTEDLRTLHNPILHPLVLLLHRLKEFLLSQIRHRASQAAYIFPNAVTKFLNLLTQSYVGDITIWPKPKFSDYMRIMENPTSFEAISQFVQGGRQRAYPKIHHIKCTMMMEKQIDKCYRTIRNNSRLYFLKSLTQIEDAAEDQLMLTRHFKQPPPRSHPHQHLAGSHQDGADLRQDQDFTDLRSHQDALETHPPSLVHQGHTQSARRGSFGKRLKTELLEFQEFDYQKNQGGKPKSPMRRNDSYLLPRQRSFQ